MGRAPCCDKTNVKKGPWSPEEDAKLKDYIDNYGIGGNWIALPHKIGLKRCGKSCRLRWLNYLRPNIKHGGFSEEEDNIILSLYISIGSRWSIMAAQLPGRTDNDIKNYWNTKLKKKLLGRQKQMSRPDAIIDSNKAYKSSHNLTNSALERLQLHMQLQNLHNLFSNPILWPKLHPLLHTSEANSPNLEVEKNELSVISDGVSSFCGRNINTTASDPFLNPVQDFGPSFNSSTGLSQEIQLDHNRVDVVMKEMNVEVANDFDLLKEMNVGSMSWWSDELERKTTSTSSWDSASASVSATVMDQTDNEIVMLEDYAQMSYVDSV